MVDTLSFRPPGEAGLTSHPSGRLRRRSIPALAITERVGHMTVQRATATCSCGNVSIALNGPPIYCAACHCDDCQTAAQNLDELPTPEPTMDAYGGTHYVLYRKDRYVISFGSELLRPHKLRESSPTSRMVASCCNTPMFLAFNNAQHWISMYRFRIKEQTPRLQSRVATRFSKHPETLPNDVPSYRTFPIKMVVRLLLSKVQMTFGR